MTEEEINTYVSEKNKTKCSWSNFSFFFAVMCIIGFSLLHVLFLSCLISILPLFAILSILCGIIALIKIKKSNGLLTGKIYAGIGILVGTGFFLFFASIFLWVGKSVLYIREKESKLKSPAIYEPAAKELAQYCQAVTTEMRDTGLGNAWYPATIRNLNPFYGVISPKGASIVFAGGFYHLGYKLELDENASTEKESVWNLSILTETSDKYLCTVRLDKTNPFTIDKLIETAIDGYNSKPQQSHNKIMFLLVFNRPEMAYQACKELIEKNPKDWWPRLTLAFMEAVRTDPNKAGENFATWVEKYPCYTYYLYLSFFYQKEGQTENAALAIRKALGQPLRGSQYASERYNVYYHAANAVIWACENNKNNLSLAICNSMTDPNREHERADSVSGEVWQPKFKELRRIILAQDSNAIHKWIEETTKYGRFNPYQAGNTNATQKIKVGNHYFPEDVNEQELSYILGEN